MGVKLKAALPKDDESNGLDDGVAAEFLAKPRVPRVGIVVLTVEEVVESLATGVKSPKVRVERIELVTDGEEADGLVARAQALSEVRTGSTPLPIEGYGLGFDDEGPEAA